MRLGLAGGVIVVLVALAIVMLQPGSPRLIEVGCRSLPNQAQFVREESDAYLRLRDRGGQTWIVAQ